MSSFFAFIFYTIGYDTFILVFSHFHSFYFLSYLTFCFFLSSFNFFFPFHTFSFYPSFTHFHLSFQVSFTLPLTSMTFFTLFFSSLPALQCGSVSAGAGIFLSAEPSFFRSVSTIKMLLFFVLVVTIIISYLVQVY